MEFRSGALRLKPSPRVRLHGRSRLPDLAVVFTLATTALFFGASFAVPADSREGGVGFTPQATGLMEGRSAAASESVLPLHTGVRVIDPDHAR